MMIIMIIMIVTIMTMTLTHSWTAWPVMIMIVITNYIEVGAQQGLHIIYMQYRISGIWTSSYLSGNR